MIMQGGFSVLLIMLASIRIVQLKARKRWAYVLDILAYSSLSLGKYREPDFGLILFLKGRNLKLD